jgi:parvulin-like peptidyl-prolyl isomerase
MAHIQPLDDFNFDLTPTNLIPFLSSQAILTQILREMILDRAIAPIDYNPGDIANLPEDASHAATAIRQYKIQQFKIQQWGNQLEQYFLQRKRHLDQVVYSMIRTPEAGLTQELYFRAKEQEASFADLARSYSQGPEALTNGIVGPVAIATLPPQIAQKLAGMRPSDISSPIKFQNQWVIFKLERVLPAQLNEPTKSRLLHELFDTWLQEQITQQLPRFAQSQRSCNNSDFSLLIAA